MKKTTLLLIGTAIMTLTSCVKDKLFDTPHPDSGALTITTDWSAKSDDASIPTKYTLMVGDIKQEVSAKTNLFEKLLAPGNHNLTIYNVPEGMSLSGSTISIDRASDDAIESMPGTLFIANSNFDIFADYELTLKVPMHQYIRRLELVLTVQQGQYERVSSARATLGGICSSIDILSEQRSPAPAKAISEITRDGNKFLLAYNLLGIIPAEKQTLNIDITFNNGDTQSIESDLTSLLSDYHSEVFTLKLAGDLFLPLEGGFSGVISGWEVANGGNSDAH